MKIETTLYSPFLFGKIGKKKVIVEIDDSFVISPDSIKELMIIDAVKCNIKPLYDNIKWKRKDK